MSREITEARSASPETCLEARVIVPLLQQNAATMDQLMCSQTDTESRSAERTEDGDAREESGGLAGLRWNGKIAFMAGLIL